MKNSSIIRKIILACLLCVLGVLIGLIGEIIGNDLGTKLNSIGLNTTVLYICLIICSILSILSIIFIEKINGEPINKDNKALPYVIKIKRERSLHPGLKYFLKIIGWLFSIPIVIFCFFAGVFYLNQKKVSQLDYFELATSCQEINNYECALNNYSKVLEINPDNSFALNARGSIYLQQGENEKALKDFNKAIQNGHKMAYNNRGMVYLNQEKYEEAFSDFDYLINHYSKEITALEAFLAYQNRAACYFFTEKYDLALKDINRSITLNPNDASSYENRALLYEKMGNKEKAQADYAEANKRRNAGNR